MRLTYESIAKKIDHSLLGPTLTRSELEEGCRLAARYGVASVCIKPHAVALARDLLRDTGVAVGTTVGFPHGAHGTAVKVFEAERAMAEGATELDMVVNIGAILGGDWDLVREDIAAVTRAAKSGAAILKVIFENCYLNDDQKMRLCVLCGELGVDYVKTSTGYGTGGAVHADLILMRKNTPPHVKLKAAGGIRDLDSLLAVVELGCERVGASKTSEILDEFVKRFGR